MLALLTNVTSASQSCTCKTHIVVGQKHATLANGTSDMTNGSWGFLLHILRRRQVRFSTSGYCKAKVAVKPGKAEHVFFSNMLFRGQLGSQLWPYANLLHVRSSLVLPVAIPKYYVCQILQEMTPVWSWEITLSVWQADSSLSKGHVSRKHPQLLRIDVILSLEIKTKHTTWHPDLLQPRIASTEFVSKACPICPQSSIAHLYSPALQMWE